MKILFSLLMSFVFSPVFGSTVTIDFEENPADTNGIVLSKGYELGGSSWDTFSSYDAYISASSNGTLAFGGDADAATCNSGGCNGVSLSLKREDDGFFALYSYDLLTTGVLFGVEVTGTTAGGQTVTLSTPLGTGDWLNLQNVFFYADNQTGSFAPAIAVQLDNIVVGAAVPIPAAVWLFGSALAGLGWVRRKSVIRN